jgi:methionyl-tRNA formyltransferase
VTDGPVRTVFLGSGGFGEPSLRRLAAEPRVDLVGVITAPAKPVGRQQTVSPTPIRIAAEEVGLQPILTPARLRDPAVVGEILDLKPDLVVLADYGQIVPPPLLDVRHGALNLHPSLLPRYRGASPIPATILAGDRETGVTLMQMDEGLDTGPIVAQERVPLSGTETTPILEQRLADVAADILTDTVGPWTRGELTARPQSISGMTVTSQLRREDARLDPSKSSVELDRQVRAYQPWPGSYVETVAGRLLVWRSEPVGVRLEGEDTTPGRIGRFGMYTGDGTYLAFREVQPAGGKRMDWDAFVRGRPVIVGSSIVG